MTAELKPFDDRPKIIAYHRQDNSKRFLTDVLYMVKLQDTMKMIIPFFWNPGKKIIDLTAGKRLIWGNMLINHRWVDGSIAWKVKFNDINKKTKANYHKNVTEINKLKKHWDIAVLDLPFIALKDGVESFGVRSRAKFRGKIIKDKEVKSRREFYFNYFVPPEINFHKMVFAINKITDNLIIKMGNSHANKVMIPNVIFAILNFDKRFNPRSQFYCINDIIYRGNYSKRGGRFPFAQNVHSSYLIFKKDPDSR